MAKQGMSLEMIESIRVLNEAKTDEEFLAGIERLFGLPASKDDRHRFSACTFHFAPERE